jgi:two-component system CheB/CheR fusion protein
VNTGEIYEIECRFKKASDNLYRWHLGHALPFKDEEGNVITWVGTCTDIEDQKKAMEKKDEFIGIASHELKTPLTSLKGYIQIIDYNKNELPLKLHPFVTKANESITKLQNLISDLLDVSKIQAGKLEFSTAVIDIGDVINSCIENSLHIYPSFIITRKPLKKLLVNGNFERLEQVLMNLISNAVKYVSDRKEIIIDAIELEACVQVSVRDFGIGLTEENKEKIFERFFRVEDKKFLTSGLGMGLYISSEIIKSHKGYMHVESKINEGSTFYFTLPLENKVLLQ